MTKIIAEIGWNFIGDMSLAKEMIASAANAGADFAKFQTWSVKNLRSGPWDNDGRRQIYEKAELDEAKHLELKSECENNNIEFLTSCFSKNSIPMLSKITSAIKIPSTEIANLELLKGISNSFETVFLSTGASTEDEITKAVDVLKHNKLTILHCVCSYPCDYSNANMKKILWLKKFGHPVGYSGHCIGIFDAIQSIEYGVSLVEKHFTTDHNLPGRDNKFAILPDELFFLKQYLLNKDKMNGFQKNYQECEQEMRNVYRGRWDA